MSSGHDHFWAEFFGIPAGELASTGVSIGQHVGLAGYQGVWFFLHGSRLIVSAPPGWVSHLRAHVSGARAELPSSEAVSQLFGSSLEHSIGPGFHGAADASTFRPGPTSEVRALRHEDEEALETFRSACGAEDWEVSGLDQALLYRTLSVRDGAIATLGGFRPRSRNAGDPCVLTHPDYRGSGLARSVVTSILASALEDDQVLLYQTLESNIPAVRLARSLGYAQYANHVAIRLSSPHPRD